MDKTISMKAFLPIAVAAVVAMIIAPALMVSANEGGEGEKRCDNNQRLHIAEVIQIDTEANTILIQKWRGPEGEERGDQPYVLVSYDDETIIKVDKKESDESAIQVGNKIHVRGEVNHESEEYRAEIAAEYIVVWDELEPERRKHKRGEKFKGKFDGERPEFNDDEQDIEV